MAHARYGLVCADLMLMNLVLIVHAVTCRDELS